MTQAYLQATYYNSIDSVHDHVVMVWPMQYIVGVVPLIKACNDRFLGMGVCVQRNKETIILSARVWFPSRENCTVIVQCVGSGIVKGRRERGGRVGSSD